MPYFSGELHALMAELSDWADLRKEQGVPARAVIRDVVRDLRRARTALKRMQPPEKLLRREPDDLDAIRSLRPEGPRRLWDRLDKKTARDRISGAWLGRAAGCTLGAPVEGWSIDHMEQLAKSCGMAFPPESYWKSHPRPDDVHYGGSPTAAYLEGGVREVPVDDDLTYTVLGLLILERFEPDFTTADVGQAWLDWLPVACTAEHVALENLRKGIAAERAAEKDNPFEEWIGADIRSDPWGYAAPGRPERAAEMAYRDAWLSHRRNGVYGAMLFSAAIAAAFATDDPVEAVRVGLTEIPKTCRLAADMAWAFEIGPELSDWRAARAAVDERFAGMSSVHTNNNACLTLFGLMLGAGDFTRTIGFTVAMGLDNDCTAATAGSLFGAAHGVDAIDPAWRRPFRNRARTYLTGHEEWRNDDLVARFLAIADQVVR